MAPCLEGPPQREREGERERSTKYLPTYLLGKHKTIAIRRRRGTHGKG